jgi:hypothetical protein
MMLSLSRRCVVNVAKTTFVAPKILSRSLHLAPPFLLDDYVPRYMTLSSRDAAKKRSLAYAHLRNCNLCPRECGVNRYEKTGMCLIGEKAKVNTIAPHFGEGQSICCPLRFALGSLYLILPFISAHKLFVSCVSCSPIQPLTKLLQNRAFRGTMVVVPSS